jgi:hypothetical protein
MLLFMAMPFLNIAQPKQITPNEASAAAITWIEDRFNANNVQVLNVYSDTGQYGILLYEVETSLKKTVLLSGSRACLPILGIYQESHLNNTNLPCGLQFMLDYYRERIDSSFADDHVGLFYANEWSDLIRGIVPPTPKGTPIAPLTTSNWKQKGANNNENVDAYNVQIQSGNGCLHCRTGCVAVAMGQVLYYWQHPVLDYSLLQQYDWCNMTDQLLTTSSTYEKNRDAIAYLLERCGHYADMDYGCWSSSANLSDAADALKDHFGFHNHTDCKSRFWHYESWWKEHVIYDLSVGRPVIYAGNRKTFSGGHAFICDGYDGGNLFHFNWGWGGNFNNPNHFYTLNNPCPKPDTNYKYWQEAIFYARPNYDENICDIDLTLDDYYTNNPYVLFNQYYNAPLPMLLFEMVPHTMTTLTSASATSDASWRTIPTGASAVYQAHNEIILQNGFEAQLGCEFEARIEPCKKCGGQRRDGLVGDDKSDCDNDNDGLFDNADYAVGSFEKTVTNDLFPNPTDGPLTMATEGMAEAVFVHDMTGHPVGSWHLEALTEDLVTLNVSSLHAGPYLLTVVTPSGACTARFIRR